MCKFNRQKKNLKFGFLFLSSLAIGYMESPFPFLENKSKILSSFKILNIVNNTLKNYGYLNFKMSFNI